MNNQRITFFVLLAVGVLSLAWSRISLSKHSRHPVISDSTYALVGATLIDGNGGVPIPNATILITGKRITYAGPALAKLPRDLNRIIDYTGKFVMPGLIDANVHLTPIELSWDKKIPSNEVIESEIVSQLDSFHSYGVTTVRDTYGYLTPLLHVREMLKGYSTTRLLFCGNIIGFDARGTASHLPGYVRDFKSSKEEILLRKYLDTALVQNTGEDLGSCNLSDLRRRIGIYLDKDVDFIKIGVSTHSPRPPVFMIFSQAALEVMVNEAHIRGKVVDTHTSSPESLRAAVLAGVDVVQHPEIFSPKIPLQPELAQMIARKKIVCSIFPGEYRSLNQIELIKAGCIIAVATDNTRYASGKATINAIISLNKLGMSTLNCITAATKNGALACGALNDFGTIESGKFADLVILDSNPLLDIKNIRSIQQVIIEGKMMRPNY